MDNVTTIFEVRPTSLKNGVEKKLGRPWRGEYVYIKVAQSRLFDGCRGVYSRVI